MKVVLLVVGRSDVGYWSDALADYSERLKHYIPFEVKVIPDNKNGKNLSEIQKKEHEGRLIVKSLQVGDDCILLDERGKQYTSLEFALFVDKKLQSSPRRLVFVTGGPYGVSDAVFEHASEKISLSKMTFSHQMVRPVFVEQLYRAMTILRGEAYHHS